MKVKGTGGFNRIVVSEHEDEVLDTSTGYGSGQKPEDYLTAFNDFVNANSNRMVAIQTVIQRPWELTRESLKQLALELEKTSLEKKISRRRGRKCEMKILLPESLVTFVKPL